jgi:hypothetical protein
MLELENVNIAAIAFVDGKKLSMQVIQIKADMLAHNVGDTIGGGKEEGAVILIAEEDKLMFNAANPPTLFVNKDPDADSDWVSAEFETTEAAQKAMTDFGTAIRKMNEGAQIPDGEFSIVV